MPAFLERLDTALRTLGEESGTGASPTPEDVCDLLLLARHLPQDLGLFRGRAPSGSSPSTGPLGATPGIQDQPSPAPGASPPPLGGEGGTEPSASGNLRSLDLSGQAERRRGRVVGVPAAAPLPNSLALGRALRPVRIRCASRRRMRVDEERTALRAGRTGIWEPILVAGMERWPDLALVVDSAPMMAIWSEAVEGLRSLLQHVGAFREFREWRLYPGDSTPVVAARLTPPLDAKEPRPAALETLRSPTGRRLVLVVTDGVDGAWGAGGQYGRMLRDLAATNPVVVISLLPDWMWPAGGIRTQPGRVRLEAPLLPNKRWSRQRMSRASGQGGGPADAHVDIPIPVADLTSWRLARYVSTVAGGTQGATLRLLRTNAASPTAGDTGPAATGGIPDDPWLVVPHLRSRLSPEAYRLLLHLASAPLDIDFIRLVQERLMPGTGVVELAEILLSDLVEPVADPGVPFGSRYRFRRPGLRRVLLDHAGAHLRRETHAQLRWFVETRFGRVNAEFDALLEDLTRLDTFAVFDIDGPGVTLPPVPSPPVTAPRHLVEMSGGVAPQRRERARELAQAYLSGAADAAQVVLSAEDSAGAPDRGVSAVHDAWSRAKDGVLVLEGFGEVGAESPVVVTLRSLLAKRPDTGPRMLVAAPMRPSVWRLMVAQDGMKVQQRVLLSNDGVAGRCYRHILSGLSQACPDWTVDFEDELWRRLVQAEPELCGVPREHLVPFASSAARAVTRCWQRRVAQSRSPLPMQPHDIPADLHLYLLGRYS